MDKASQTERRGARRRRVLKGGIIAFNDRRSTIACTVRDISATGARLRVEGSVAPPRRFVLIIELDGLEADCEVVSRRAKELGVKFVAPRRSVVPRRVQVMRTIGRR